MNGYRRVLTLLQGVFVSGVLVNCLCARNPESQNLWQWECWITRLETECPEIHKEKVMYRDPEASSQYYIFREIVIKECSILVIPPMLRYLSKCKKYFEKKLNPKI